MRKLATIFIIAFLLPWNITAYSREEEKYISAEQLFKIINTGNIDRIIESINVAKGVSYQGEILPLMRDLWDKRVDKYPQLPWRIVNKDIIRLEVADILIQGDSNGLITVDRDAIHEFVSQSLDSDDVFVQAAAISTISLFDDEKDVVKILEISNQQKRRTFGRAVLTLTKICLPAARKALDELDKKITRPDLRDYLTNIRQKMESFYKRTNWCSFKRSR
ncbi:MAG: hypothetical protein IIB65_12785 [Proteobacteria bacterium]|nr:hypothetical protein [Pseudomonadota bacterium]